MKRPLSLSATALLALGTLLIGCAEDASSNGSDLAQEGASANSTDSDSTPPESYTCVLKKQLATAAGSLTGQAAELATYKAAHPTPAFFSIQEDNVADLPIRFNSASDPLEPGKFKFSARVAMKDLSAQAQSQATIRRGEEVETTLFVKLPTSDPNVFIVSVKATCRLL